MSGGCMNCGYECPRCSNYDSEEEVCHGSGYILGGAPMRKRRTYKRRPMKGGFNLGGYTLGGVITTEALQAANLAREVKKNLVNEEVQRLGRPLTREEQKALYHQYKMKSSGNIIKTKKMEAASMARDIKKQLVQDERKRIGRPLTRLEQNALYNNYKRGLFENKCTETYYQALPKSLVDRRNLTRNCRKIGLPLRDHRKSK